MKFDYVYRQPLEPHRAAAFGLLLLCCGVSATGALLAPSSTGPATLTWGAPTQFTNGAPITTPVTYTVFKGLEGWPQVKVASGVKRLRYVFPNLPVGKRYCFTVKAVVAGYKPSDPSNVACKTIVAP